MENGLPFGDRPFRILPQVRENVRGSALRLWIGRRRNRRLDDRARRRRLSRLAARARHGRSGDRNGKPGQRYGGNNPAHSQTLRSYDLFTTIPGAIGIGQ